MPQDFSLDSFKLNKTTVGSRFSEPYFKMSLTKAQHNALAVLFRHNSLVNRVTNLRVFNVLKQNILI